MMRIFWMYLIGLLLIAGVVVATVFAVKDSNHHDDKTSTTTSAVVPKKPTSPEKKACDIFTLTDAKRLMGGNVKGGENTEPASSSDLTVSTCTYTQDTGNSQPVSQLSSASLLLRHPTTPNGVSSNHNAFGSLKPADLPDVPGYGDAAYWDAEHGQLNILKTDNWYILNYGPATPSSRTLDQTKQLADLLISKM